MILKKIAIVIALFIIPFFTFSQLKKLKIGTTDSWIQLKRNYQISNNGKFVCYETQAAISDVATLYIVTSTGALIDKIPNAMEAFITSDSKYVVSGLRGGGIVVIDLLKNKRRKLTDSELRTVFNYVDQQYMVYRSGKDLIIEELHSMKKHSYSETEDFKVSENGNTIALKVKSKLSLITLPEFTEIEISKGLSYGRFELYKTGKRIAFTTGIGSGRAISYFHMGMKFSRVLVSSQLNNIPDTFELGEEFQFSENGEWLTFDFVKPYVLKNDSVKVTVWNFRDKYLQCDHSAGAFVRSFAASVSVSSENAKVVILEDAERRLLEGIRHLNQFVLTSNRKKERELFFYDEELEYRIVSRLDGSEKKFTINGNKATRPIFSPDQEFVVWGDTSMGDYFSYNLKSDRISNLTSNIKLSKRFKSGHNMKLFQSGWLDTKNLLINDGYNMWKVDVTGIKSPIRLTGDYRSDSTLKIEPSYVGHEPNNLILGNTLLVSIMSDSTKKNGFAYVNLDGKSELKITVLDTVLFDWPSTGTGFNVLKAKNADVFLLTKQSAVQAPNLYLSKDLKNFKKISDLNPQKGYNWMTSELVHYPMKNGKAGTAILYKPQDFDPKKIYPIIFNYYQFYSDGLNKFGGPGTAFDIPRYVSNGYLVCVPDISNSEYGAITETTLSSVEGAAYFLSNFSWVNPKKMGITGHSFGGYETNILAANSKLFAAAHSYAGLSDMISGSGSPAYAGEDMWAYFQKTGIFRLGATLWERPDIFIKNSPIYQANKVQTPILITHGTDDTAVSINQAVEFFTALRWLRKSAWMLVYKDQGHGIDGGPAGNDFSIREQQFFDHYLKDKPAPEWMTKENPATVEGITRGQLNPSN